jgi:uncharacterized membrane protein YeaQ/YmgE (transglycosylase-associated protein family)
VLAIVRVPDDNQHRSGSFNQLRRLRRHPPSILAEAAVMTTNMLITWLVVGLVAGLVAAVLVRGGGFGVLGDIVVGIAGAIFGGWAFRSLGWHAPLSGTAGVIAVAFEGALILLIVANLIRYRAMRPHRV